MPTGQAGWFAYVVATSTYWYWDVTPGNWVNTGSANSPGVTLFNGRQGAVEPETGDYTVEMVTGAAPLNSPNLTGTPTSPTAIIGTNTTQIATTEYVNNNSSIQGVFTPSVGDVASGDTFKQAFQKLQGSKQSNLYITTVGATLGQYSTCRSAFSSGAKIIRIIENTTETGTTPLLTMTNIYNNVLVVIDPGVIWDCTSLSSSGIVMPVASGASSFYLLSGLGSKLSYSPTTDYAAFVNAVPTGTGVNYNDNATFYRGDFNFDISGTDTARAGISLFRGIGNIISDGVTNVYTPNCTTSGLRYIGVNTSINENANINIFGGGSNSNQCIYGLLNNNVKAKFSGAINLIGDFDATNPVISINGSFSNGIISRANNPITIEIGGNSQGIYSISSSSLSINILDNNIALSNANLNGGTLNVNSRQNVKINNCSFGLITNQNDTTLISNTTIGVKPVNKIANYLAWTWTIARSGFSTNILNSATPQNFFQYFMTGLTPPTPTLAINDMQLKATDFVFNATDPLSPILIFPAIDGDVEYTVRVTITGAYSGATGTVRVLPFDIQRVSDNSLVGSPKHIKDLNTNTIVNEFIELTTRTLGLTDNFSVTGIRFQMIQNTGATLTLTSVQLYISARVIKLN